jgi:hypothetical protein
VKVFSQLTLQAAYEWNYGERRFNEGMIKKIRQVGEHRCFLNLLLNFKSLQLPCSRGHRGRDRMVVRFTTTYAIGANHY